jgi:hypothetical protein
VACPFFHPTEPFEDGAWLTPPRLPLGDPCKGRCTADPGAPVEPPMDDLRRLCNLGYARGACSRFPATAEAPDAVRFSVARDRQDLIELIYIVEKDYGPVRHGPLVWETVAGNFTANIDSPALEAQARRFVESYVKRRVHL